MIMLDSFNIFRNDNQPFNISEQTQPTENIVIVLTCRVNTSVQKYM